MMCRRTPCWARPRPWSFPLNGTSHSGSYLRNLSPVARPSSRRREVRSSRSSSTGLMDSPWSPWKRALKPYHGCRIFQGALAENTRSATSRCRWWHSSILLFTTKFSIAATEPRRVLSPNGCRILDVLTHLDAASGILVLGSTEPHYRPSKVFQSLMSRRPVLALLHERGAYTPGQQWRSGRNAVGEDVTLGRRSRVPARAVRLLEPLLRRARSLGRSRETLRARVDTRSCCGIGRERPSEGPLMKQRGLGPFARVNLTSPGAAGLR